MDPNTTMETVGAGAKALTKFGEIIEKHFGPKWTRKQADADAYADQKKLQTIRDNPDMEITYVDGKLNARQKAQDALAFRAEQRMLAEAVRQERNIESVLEATTQELPHADSISDEPVSDDWITRFFNIAKDVNNEEMQYIWGKILAGEIASPQSFSMRTLETIRNMSTAEAQKFQRIIQLVLHRDRNYFILSNKDILNKYGIHYSDIMELDDCGLMDSSGMLSLSFDISNSQPAGVIAENLLILLEGKKDKTEKISFGVYTLTRAGKELFSILSHDINTQYVDINTQYVKDAAAHIWDRNRTKAIVSVYVLIDESDGKGEVQFPIPIASFPIDESDGKGEVQYIPISIASFPNTDN